MSHIFTFMGTGAGCGVPAFFCDCPACQEARENPSVARGDCGVMVRGIESGTTLLIDTPPDTRHQLNREGIREFDELLYTHWHSDHIGGLLEMEYMMQLRTKRPIPVHASQYTLNQIAHEFHYMTYALDMHAMDFFDTFEYDGVRYTALPVTHAPGTFGWLIETPGTADKPGTRLFYASDTGLLPDETRERLQGVDILAMDATYWKDCPYPAAHHSVQQCIEEGLELDAGTIYLTHLCMHYTEPITFVQLEEYLQQYGGRVRQATDGLSFEI